jgi:hypothetical protein
MAELNQVPIIIFAYNRPGHLSSLIEGLKRCNNYQKFKYFVFVDGPKTQYDQDQILSIRNVIENSWLNKTAEVHFEPQNQGLAKSVISGVNKVLENHDRLIVLEDDLSLHFQTLDFLDLCLEHYYSNNEIGSISAYLFPLFKTVPEENKTFLLPRISSWGWATWKNRWEKAAWDNEYFIHQLQDESIINKLNYAGEDIFTGLIKNELGLIDSWAMKWAFHHVINNLHSVYPSISMVQHVGNDGSGTHVRRTASFDIRLPENSLNMVITEDPKINREALKALQNFFKLNPIQKLKRKVFWEKWKRKSRALS